MRKKLVAGNWKMNLDWNKAMTLVADLVAVEQSDWSSIDVGICVPYIYQRHAKEFLANAGSKVFLGAQDCSAETSGAFTGEVSASMLESVGTSHVIIGHSERRDNHGEDGASLFAKVEQALTTGLQVIFCCGEHLTEREGGNHEQVIGKQLDEVLFKLSPNQMDAITIAYEPVWAIGTGVTASPQQAQDMHAYIRGAVQNQFGEEIAINVRILYGGSVKSTNADDLFRQPDIDGGLIGGASLSTDQFLPIIEAALKA